MTGIPVERLDAMIRLLYPEEMTPTAKRMLRKLADEYRGYEREFSAVTPSAGKEAST